MPSRAAFTMRLLELSLVLSAAALSSSPPKPVLVLGATGKVRDGRRHPAVGAGVTLGSGASVLGPITVGDGATVGANACVTKDVEAGATVVETGYLNNRVLAPRKKKAS